MTWPEPVTLQGRFAKLEPLTHRHAEAMTEAARDGELWKLWYTAVPTPDEMMAEIDRRLDLQSKGSMLPFAVLDEQDVPVGMTTYMNIDAANKRVEIGQFIVTADSKRSVSLRQLDRIVQHNGIAVITEQRHCGSQVSHDRSGCRGWIDRASAQLVFKREIWQDQFHQSQPATRGPAARVR